MTNDEIRMTNELRGVEAVEQKAAEEAKKECKFPHSVDCLALDIRVLRCAISANRL